MSMLLRWWNRAEIGYTDERASRRCREAHWLNLKEIQYTRSQRKASESTDIKSALTDHATRINHMIDWDNTTIVGRGDIRLRRQNRETIRIRQETRPLNRDQGSYDLPQLWGPLLTDSHSTGNSRVQSAVRTKSVRWWLLRIAAESLTKYK